jgi:hypothetical protein
MTYVCITYHERVYSHVVSVCVYVCVCYAVSVCMYCVYSQFLKDSLMNCKIPQVLQFRIRIVLDRDYLLTLELGACASEGYGSHSVCLSVCLLSL